MGTNIGIVGSDATGLGTVAMPGNRLHVAYTIPSSLGMYQTQGGGPVIPGLYRFQNLIASCAVTFVVTSASSQGTPPVACSDVVFTPTSSDFAGDVLVTGADCQTATVVVQALRHCPGTCGPDARRYDARTYSTSGFNCSAGGERQPPGGGMSWDHYACVAGSSRITFDKF